MLYAGERGRWCQGLQPTSTTMSRDESRCWSQGLSKTSDHTVVTLLLSTLNFLSLRHAFAYDVDRGAHRRDHTIDQTHRP